MPFVVAGLGTAVPEHSISQADAARIAQTINVRRHPEMERLVSVLYRRTGVQQRHSVLLHQSEGELEDRQNFYPPAADSEDNGPGIGARMAVYEGRASALGLEAAAKALAQAEISPQRVTHLITVSCTGFQAPGVDFALIRELGLPAGVARTNVGFMGCHGALNGLRVAHSFIEANPAACVLLVAVELCSIHHDYGNDRERIVANALFADGAAAIVGRHTELAQPTDWQVSGNASTVLPDSQDMMSWRVSDNGFVMSLSPQLPDLIRNDLKPWLTEWLGNNDLKLEDVGSWAVHPGGPAILQAVTDAVDLPAESLADSRGVLAEFGNMSSPTVMFILDRLRQRQAARPCVMLGFGPGIAVEAALVR